VAIVGDLFIPSNEPGYEAMTPLGKAPDWYLANRNSSSEVREMLEQRFQYRFSDAYVAAASKRVAPDKYARRIFNAGDQATELRRSAACSSRSA
jgi:hypothetical protein